MMDMKNEMPCPMSDCQEVSGTHSVSGIFKVMTAAHAVYNDEEARNTTIEFFFDSDEDMSTVVRARGLRVSSFDCERNRSVLECFTHDLQLWKTLQHFRDKKIRIQRNLKIASPRADSEMVVLVSHPHGLSKRISIGGLVAIEKLDHTSQVGGASLAECLLTYTTATCPGAGGGAVTVYRPDGISLAFAPHCSTCGDKTNKSGLGWTLVM